MPIKLSQLLEQIKENQIYEAHFTEDKWYITMYAGHIWYADYVEDEMLPYLKVPLTYSNIHADYYLTNLTLD